MRRHPRLFGPLRASSSHLALFFGAFGAGVFGLGCGDASPQTGSVIVGLTSELRVPVDMQSLQITMRVNGAVVRSETRESSGGAGALPLTFPTELPFEGLLDGDAVEVELHGFGGGGGLLFPVVERLASTEVVGGRKLLMRVPLETECAPVGSSQPMCEAPMTCITGMCRDSHLSPTALEPYNAFWSKPSDDICKPPGAGDPVVIVGKGQSDYFAMEDGELAQIEAGPQGGHHIWVALRMKNLAQSGSITTVTGYVPDLDLQLSPFNVIFTFDQDEGGYCKLYGLRYQLDTDGVDVKTVFGHTMKVTVKVSESKAGGVGMGERIVKLSGSSL